MIADVINCRSANDDFYHFSRKNESSRSDSIVDNGINFNDESQLFFRRKYR